MTETLRFPGEDAVTVGYVSDFYELLRAIDEVMPKDAVLCVEGRPTPDVEAFLEERLPTERPAVEPGTLWPKSRVFHLPLSGNNLIELRTLAEAC